jgi:hypothetical protein
MERIIWTVTNTMHCLSAVYRVITPLHVSALAAHHQEVECIYVACGTVDSQQPGLAADCQLYHLTHIFTYYLLMMGCW